MATGNSKLMVDAMILEVKAGNHSSGPGYGSRDNSGSGRPEYGKQDGGRCNGYMMQEISEVTTIMVETTRTLKIIVETNYGLMKGAVLVGKA